MQKACDPFLSCIGYTIDFRCNGREPDSGRLNQYRPKPFPVTRQTNPRAPVTRSFRVDNSSVLILYFPTYLWVEILADEGALPNFFLKASAARAFSFSNEDFSTNMPLFWRMG